MIRQQVLRQTVGDIVDRLFGGSAESLVMNLLETRRLTPETLSRLNALVDQEATDGQDK